MYFSFVKKIAVFSLVLALMGPAIGFLCACSPVAEASNGTPTLESSHCDCCGVFEFKKDVFRFQSNESLIPALVRFGSSSALVALAFSPAERSNGMDRQAASPPRFSHKTPLFLAQSVLRL